jgi:primase-polymerase (primpol)-like protein
MTLTIEALKLQKRWVLWRLEPRPGEKKDTKVPYQVNGYRADSTDPSTWVTYAEAAQHAHRFSGIGCVTGNVDGVHLCGVDIDECCDAQTGKFTPESKEIVIGLDSYSEYSPSGTGVHILMLGTLHGRKGMKLPFPGAKAVELYDRDRYLTFTGRQLPKAPGEIVEREEAVKALYDRVLASKAKNPGLTIFISVSEEERLARLMAGDMSLHHDDHSTADFALCCLLAKKHDCNAFKIDDEFRDSKLAAKSGSGMTTVRAQLHAPSKQSLRRRPSCLMMTAWQRTGSWNIWLALGSPRAKSRSLVRLVVPGKPALA